MTHDEIRAAIAASPELQALQAAGNTQGIADALSLGRTKTVKVAIADLQAYMQTQGIWWVIKDVAADPQHLAQAAAVAVVDVAGARYENIDMSLPVVSQMLGGLVATGVITTAHQTDMEALGVVADPVTHTQVGAAIQGAI